MTITDQAERVSAGHLLLVGEVRSADVRAAGYVDKKTGLAATSLLITYFVELPRLHGFEVAKVTQRVPGVIDAASVSIPVEKGRRYAFEIDRVERKPGYLVVWMANVDPEIVEDSAPALNLVLFQTTPRIS